MKKNKMKMLGILLLLITAISVVLTFLVVAKLTSATGKKEETQTVFQEDTQGIVENVYVVSSQKNEVVILYKGKRYLATQTAESDYTGVADIELSQGKIVHIYAKPESVSGILDSYTENTVQIEGYEPLACVDNLPVYLLENENGVTSVRQGNLSDLVIGNSRVQLVVAGQTACALLVSKQSQPEKIRVLLKDKEQTLYPDIFLSCSGSCKAGDKSYPKGKMLQAKTLLSGKKNGEEVSVTPEQGLLYLCDAKGKKKSFGYEGTMILRKQKGGYVLLNELSVEDYVRYVLPSEMPPSFSEEALKAQAVCARTFAYSQMKNDAYAKYGANLDNTTAYQVYHAAKPTEKTNQAVRDTEGIVITSEGKLIDCYYYSTSAGYGENLEVWDTKSPAYLTLRNYTGESQKNLSKKRLFHSFITKKVSSVDDSSPYYRWTAALSNKLGMDEKYGKLKSMKVEERSKSGYVLKLTVTFEKGKRTYEKENEIRYALGKYLLSLTLADGTERTNFHSVPSACFEVASSKEGTIVLKGGGFGHGIGMSQYGADAMGREGKNWQEILLNYYQDVKITSVDAAGE